jgi:hypothetical protein
LDTEERRENMKEKWDRTQCHNNVEGDGRITLGTGLRLWKIKARREDIEIILLQS